MKLTRRAILASSLFLVSGAWGKIKLADLVVGFIYVGPKNDLGYNQTHATSAQILKDTLGIKIIEQERVPESNAVAKVMEGMIVQDNAKIIYPTSYGYYEPYVLDLAKKYPEVIFRHAGGRWREGDPSNIGSYFAHMHEGQYLAGYTAGVYAKNARIGFVASFRYPGVMRNINAFTLGAQLANPDVEVKVIFTGSWSNPTKEAEAVNVFVDQGATVIGCSVDSAKTVIETANRRNVYSCGYNNSMAKFGGEKYLTSGIVDWSRINLQTVNDVLNGKQPSNYYSGGIAEGLIKYDTPGVAVEPLVVNELQEIETKMKNNELYIWTGKMVDNEGKIRIQDGERIKRENPLLQQMDWFVQGIKA